jgi:hypothetical protein
VTQLALTFSARPTFWLGTHKPAWLKRTSVPLFVSRRSIADMRTPPRALGPWVLDSGGFTEIGTHGRWTVTARAYVDEVRRLRDDVGNLAWAAPQDWMCEPPMLHKTGLTVDEHQRRTVDNLLELRALAPDLPIAPVLQGWEARDYVRCVELYADAGVDLVAEPIVGVGTVCRRQGTVDGVRVIHAIRGAAPGIRLHGFGFKTKGLALLGSEIASADSMAWSYDARFNPPLPGHTHRSCANCMEYALLWRSRLLDL